MSSAKMGIKDKIKPALVFMDFTSNRLPVLTICDIPAQVTYIGFGLGAFYDDR